jgi:hypothetical protein
MAEAGSIVRGLTPILNLIRLAFWKWAQREIDPLHPDAPKVTLRINEIENPQPVRGLK